MTTITGTYDKTLSRDEKSGYTTFSFITKDCDQYKTKTGKIICNGTIPMYTVGIPLKIDGKFIKVNKELYSFEVENIVEFSNKRDITINYLSSKTFGFGESTATKIVDAIGCNVFEFAKEKDAFEKLTKALPKMNKDKAKRCIDIIKTTTTVKQIYDYIYKFGGEYSHALDLFAIYKTKALDELKKNPYKTGVMVEMPFGTCDIIAKNNGIQAYDKRRIEALFECAIKTFTLCGNIYSDIEDVTKMANYLILNSAFKNDFIPQYLLIRAAYTSQNVIIEDGDTLSFYYKPFWISENNIVKNVNRIQSHQVNFSFDDSIVDKIETKFNIKYSAKQKTAFNFLKTSGIKILTGGPGTGKTTVINGIISAYKQLHPDKIITLCAPTGRAAQRMSESTNMKATTIHRLLNLKPNDNLFTCRDQTNPLTADFLIIDEMSMVDEALFSMLIGAIKDNALVLLCGDSDQLSSVGAGSVLNDLIESNRFEVNKLDVIYRQSGLSSIVYNAIEINKGKHNLKTDKTFQIIKAKSENEIREKVLKLVTENYDPANPYALQVLASTKKGDCGTNKINEQLQELCNPNPAQITYGSTQYKIGDKILMQKNNYDIGYVNGDIGIITDISEKGVTVNINNTEMLIEKKLLKDMSLSYGMTIHKSQGSEYNSVIIVLPKNPIIMLKKNLLYTAVTRAKSNVIIITEDNAIETAVRTLDTSKRKTKLKDKLSGYNPKLIGERI